ncbi:DUF4276 family protein [Pseudanabaena sp. FACHB-1998]|uniref:DUF4276 family protein n=1 Tax=Pseudanabaena sp. FACHB-1998 TaxID=2692858 RepID=UPI001680C16A|nr:DUF4276 family protein [Pseudanabaena sp. FACHB-1998]MBD2175596.1 DUF4276 family protein [Pseudanabaena sp. FACHB-1998]
MNDFKYTLIADGRTDDALIPILTWLLINLGVKIGIQPQLPILGSLRNPPKRLQDKIAIALDLFPCNILFIHRDAESDETPIETRTKEIRKAEKLIKKTLPPIVCVIPIKMIESWLLFNEEAIRKVVGNPSGRQNLSLPKISEIEKIADPKERLEKLLTDASFPNRRGKRVNIPSNYCVRIAEEIEDYEPLRNLSAFQELEKEVEITLRKHFSDLLTS